MSEDSIFEKFEEQLAKLKAEVEKLRKAADENTGKIMPVKSVAGAFGSLCGIDAYPRNNHGYSYRTPSVSERAKAKKAHIEELWKAACEAHEQNITALENNKRVRERIELFMTSVGIPKEYSRYERVGKKRNPEWVKKYSGWLSDMNSNVPIRDGFEGLESEYKRHLQSVAEFISKSKREEEEQRKAKEAEAKAQESEKVRAVLVMKYGLEYSANYKDLLDAVLGKDKYLRLAHYLMRNRGDWSDGHSYADIGLSGFEVEMDKDKDIYDDIQSCIENWSGDGRVFRDTYWNYSVLFGLVPKDLYEDYEIIWSEADKD